MNTKTLPKHPVSERKAAWFHLQIASIGVAHLAIAGLMWYSSSSILVWATYFATVTMHAVAGLLMLWYHGVGAWRHWTDRGKDV